MAPYLKIILKISKKHFIFFQINYTVLELKWKHSKKQPIVYNPWHEPTSSKFNKKIIISVRKYTCKFYCILKKISKITFVWLEDIIKKDCWANKRPWAHEPTTVPGWPLVLLKSKILYSVYHTPIKYKINYHNR